MPQSPRKYGRPRYLPPQKNTPNHEANTAQSGTLPGLEGSDSSRVELTGTLDKIIFHNDENGYSVLSILPKGKLDAIAAVGHMILPEPGCLLKLTGR